MNYFENWIVLDIHWKVYNFWNKSRKNNIFVNFYGYKIVWLINKPTPLALVFTTSRSYPDFITQVYEAKVSATDCASVNKKLSNKMPSDIVHNSMPIDDFDIIYRIIRVTIKFLGSDPWLIGEGVTICR